MGKYTKKDIVYLAGLIRDQIEEYPEKPFALLTGAGCSRSAGIPLASEFVKIINERYNSRCERQLRPEQRGDYGLCMSALPTSLRKDLLDEYLKDAKVNWGHIAIAAMMEAGFIGRVLTFNFDSLLAKACGLLGFYPATYDFVTGATGQMNLIAKRAVIHLHGQGHGIAMMNSGRQTKGNTVNLEPLFKHILSEYPLITAGYSGKADAAFDTFQSIYSGAQSFFWTDYEKEPDGHIQKLLEKGERSAEFLGGADSDKFFMDLAKGLGCWPPKLFTNAYGHLLDELEFVGAFPDSSKDILEELKSELQTRSIEKSKEPDDRLEALLDEDWETLEKLINDTSMSDSDKELLALAKFSQALDLVDKDNLSEKNLVAIAKLNEEAARLKPDYHEALYNSGTALTKLARIKNDEDLFRESFEKYAEAVRIKPDDNDTFNNWGNALSDLAKTKKDERLFRESYEKYAEAACIKPDDNDTFNNWATAISDLAKIKNDEDLFRESFEKYAEAVRINPDDHDASFNWGLALFDLAKIKNDESLFRESSEKYAKCVRIKPDDYEAFSNWANTLSNLYHITGEDRFLNEAAEKLEFAREGIPDKLYNLACLKSLQGDTKAAQEALLHCEEKGTLPSGGRAHLESDSDLEPLRDLDWFKDLLSRLD